MKKSLGTIILSVATALMLAGCCAKGGSETAPLPDKGEVLTEILNARKSIRKFAADKPVTDEVMLDILWAANGINREDGRRTAPSAVNAQDIVMYVCKEDGAYLYKPATEELEKISGTDVRPIIASFNKFALDNPVILLCSDYSMIPNSRVLVPERVVVTVRVLAALLLLVLMVVVASLAKRVTPETSFSPLPIPKKPL